MQFREVLGGNPCSDELASEVCGLQQLLLVSTMDVALEKPKVALAMFFADHPSDSIRATSTAASSVPSAHR